VGGRCNAFAISYLSFPEKFYLVKAWLVEATYIYIFMTAERTE